MSSVANLAKTDISALVGTEVHTDAETLVSGVAAQDIRAILEARGVISFRDVHLTDDQQLAFARSLGTLSDESPDGIFKVAVNADLNPDSKLAGYQQSSRYWHFDGFGRRVPFLLTMLNPRGLSQIGGETEIANLYAAYDDLPEDEEAYLGSLRVVHSFESMMRAAVASPSDAELSDWRRQPEISHPLVWSHRDGRKTLVIGASASHIESLPLAEGRALIDRLNAWSTQPRYVYRHVWRMGDLLMWNNVGTLHRAMPYPTNSGRVMHRTTLAGEEAIA